MSKQQHRITRLPNLVFSDESFKDGILGKFMCDGARTKMFQYLTQIDKGNIDLLGWGTGGRVENTKRSGLIELKIKGRSKTEWRFLFKRLPGGTNFAIIHFFLKKDRKIREQDFEAAERISVREGW